ncbi:hypothetical protein CISIN_1g0048531mg, partial [Citrus sinensis]
MDLEDKFLAR